MTLREQMHTSKKHLNKCSLSYGEGNGTLLSDFTFMHWKGNPTPLQSSCLENPREGGAGWAAVSRAAQSRI